MAVKGLARLYTYSELCSASSLLSLFWIIPLLLVCRVPWVRDKLSVGIYVRVLHASFRGWSMPRLNCLSRFCCMLQGPQWFLPNFHAVVLTTLHPVGAAKANLTHSEMNTAKYSRSSACMQARTAAAALHCPQSFKHLDRQSEIANYSQPRRSPAHHRVPLLGAGI